MIQFIESSADVIAVKITGKLMRDEVVQLMERIETSLAEKEQTHIFLEIEDFSGIEVAGLSDHFSRATPMLGKLRRFGRVAVVSDLTWIRWATKIESALLPHISYETFTSDERHRSLGSRAS